MNNTKLVKVFDTADDLLEELASFSLFELLFFNDVIEELSTTDKLHY